VPEVLPYATTYAFRKGEWMGTASPEDVKVLLQSWSSEDECVPARSAPLMYRGWTSRGWLLREMKPGEEGVVAGP